MSNPSDVSDEFGAPVTGSVTVTARFSIPGYALGFNDDVTEIVERAVKSCLDRLILNVTFSDVTIDSGTLDGSNDDYPEEYGDPQTIKCYMCVPMEHRMNETPDHPWPERRVVSSGLGEGRADPTYWYKLDCGHVVI